MGRSRLRSRTYFFDKVIKKNDRDFEAVEVEKEINHIIQKGIENLLERLGKRVAQVVPAEMVDKFVPSADKLAEDVMIDFDIPSLYLYKHNSSIVLPMDLASFCILSRKKEDADQLLQFIKSEFQKLSEVTRDFGIELNDVLTGRKFQEYTLKQVENIQNLVDKEPRNKFEKEIIDFCAQLTSSFLPNLQISFTEPTETFEYDIYVGFSDKVKRIIEPTDYESVKDQMPTGENLKSQVILRTLDKAQRLGAKSVVIAKGFPDEVFKELKKIADSRNVILLSDTNYRNSMFKIFCSDLLEAYIG